jgi:hypothetical protein
VYPLGAAIVLKREQSYYMKDGVIPEPGPRHQDDHDSIVSTRSDEAHSAHTWNVTLSDKSPRTAALQKKAKEAK